MDFLKLTWAIKERPRQYSIQKTGERYQSRMSFLLLFKTPVLYSFPLHVESVKYVQTSAYQN